MRTLTMILLLCAARTLSAGELVGKVVAVTDGDTITVLVEQRQVKVRLNGIDAPERRQPFGVKSREALAALVHEKDVRVETSGEDRYGRTLGTVFVGECNVNREMVRNGLAWHYKRYSKDEELAELEVKAREAKIGLWADKDPVPPWEWRKRPR